MLKQCLKAENAKLKSSAIWILFFIVPIFPAVMGTFNYLGNLSVVHNGWYSLWTQHTLFYANFFYAPLIASYASYLWRLEHLNHNWNFLMTAPVPSLDILLAKFLILFKITALTQLWVGVLFFLCGKLAGLPGFLPLECVLWLIRGLFGSIGIIALSVLISMIIRSFSVPIIIALFGSILSLVLVNGGNGYFWPYALMMIGMNSNQSENNMNNGFAFVFFSIFFFVLFLALALRYLKKKDVCSAS